MQSMQVGRFANGRWTCNKLMAQRGANFLRVVPSANPPNDLTGWIEQDQLGAAGRSVAALAESAIAKATES